jgi:hypothetical protein
MNKSLSKYKKSRWIKIRLSKPHKGRLAISKMQAALIISQALATVNQIKASMSFDKLGKAAAIASTALNAFVAVSKILKVNGE